MFNNIGLGEIIIVLIVLLFLFGGDKLPEIARGLGESGKELKKVKEEMERAIKDIKDSDQSSTKLSQDGIKKGDEPDNV